MAAFSFDWHGLLLDQFFLVFAQRLFGNLHDARAQATYARVANSVCADLLPDSPKTDNLRAFAEQLEQADKEWRNSNFHTVQAAIKPAVTVSAIQLPADSKQDMTALLKNRLQGLGASLQEKADKGVPQVSASVLMGELQAGMRSVEVTWKVQRMDGTLMSFPYRSVISNSVPTSWSIFADAATEMAAIKIADLLKEDAIKAAQALELGNAS